MAAFAEGGDPPVGRPSIVGERGPELFVPKEAGSIIPNHMLRSPARSFSSQPTPSNSSSSYGGRTFHNTFNIYDSSDGQDTARTVVNHLRASIPGLMPFSD